MAKVYKRIHFFVLTRSTPRGPVRVDLTPLLARIPEDQPTSPAHCLTLHEEELLSLWKDGRGMARFGKVRRSGLPVTIKSSWGLSDLQAMGIVEFSHVRQVSTGVIGVVYNHYGPRGTQLNDVVFELMSGAVEGDWFTVSPLLDMDAMEKLDSAEGLTLLNMRVPAGFSRAQGVDENIFKFLNQLGRSKFGGDIELTIRASKDSKRSQELQALASRIPPNSVSKLRARGVVEGKVTELDLLKSRLIYGAAIVKENDGGKRLKNKSAYQSILEAFRDNEEAIMKAVENIAPNVD